MENVALTLKFVDPKASVAFEIEAESDQSRREEFGLSLPERRLNADNELLTLALTFMQDGGLPAVTAFLLLARDIINKVVPDKKAGIKRGKTKRTVLGSATEKELESIATDLLADTNEEQDDDTQSWDF